MVNSSPGVKNFASESPNKVLEYYQYIIQELMRASDKNGRWQAYEETGDYHNCLRNRRKSI